MIKEKIYDYFISKQTAREQKDITFAPSYISSCKRQIFYKKTGTETTNPISQASFFKMEMGNSIHEKIQDIISKLDNVELLECEDFKTITYRDLPFCYRIDGKVLISNEVYILELKTVYASGYNTIEKEPKKEHVLQLLLYMIFENVSKGILLYIGRDNGFMVEYSYTVNELMRLYGNELYEKIDSLNKLKQQIENKELPERDFAMVFKNKEGSITDKFTKDKKNYKSEWQCKYCGYQNLCWKDVLEKLKEYRFYIGGKFYENNTTKTT